MACQVFKGLERGFRGTEGRFNSRAVHEAALSNLPKLHAPKPHQAAATLV